MTRPAFMNAIAVLSALSGSTNGIIHLVAIARRVGITLNLNDFHEVAQQVPVLVDCKPAGKGYMEDFHYAGGLPVLLKSMASLLDLNTENVNGQRLSEILEDVSPPESWQDTIHTLDRPLAEPGALCILYGSLAPEGAVIKKAAATPKLLKHRGPAVVFESPDDVAERIDDPDLHISPDHVLVMRNAGPVAMGMPEAGSLPIPKRLAAEGITDMLRISDARMSGTAYGTVVLHCSPESAVGGPLAFVQDGDIIELDVAAQRLDLCVDAEELARRKATFVPPPKPERGWQRLYAEHVLPAHLGADLDFL